MLYGFILFVHLVACLVLIAVILLQAGRGGGFADAFGGGAAQSIFGTRATAVLTRATTAFAAIFMLTSLSLAILSVQKGRSLMERVPISKQPAPAAPTSEAQPKQKDTP